MASIVLSAVGNSIVPGIGGMLGSPIGGFIDQAIFAKDQKLPDKVIGSTLNELQVQASTYGKMLPIIYGRQRLAGNIIWAQDIKEVEVRETTTQSGGKGGGSGSVSQTTVRYEYYATIAVAVCEGRIDRIDKVWADAKTLTAKELQESSGKYNVHLGTETQTADDIIESYEGSGNVPAYRGLAYVVIEDLPLAPYGNRIPNLTFEIVRQVTESPRVEEKVKDIVLIPGSGEFVYSTEIVEKFDVQKDSSGVPRQTSKKTALNMHNFDNTANINLALDELEEAFPNLEYVAVVVNWFITSKVAANAEIIPKVEFPDTMAGVTTDWEVAGLNRATAQTVNEFSDGTPTYGGTPSDHSIIELCQAIQAKGWNVLFYPMPLVDTTSDQAGEDDKPWRGRMVPTSTSDVTTFFTRSNGYNNFIQHYSQLSVDGTDLKDLIDAFIIGSEMVGMTQYDSGSNTYPAVDRFVTLAGLVQADLGGTPLVSYAANWDEYHSVNGYYNMDPLWSSSDIDFVGIDAYFPITPDLPQSQITETLIQQYWEDGEGWDYYYRDPEARTGQTHYSDQEFAWKNVEYWWENAHDNSGTPTGWTAKMKPVWFTEFGFASVDGTANQPNVFVDATSNESAFPRESRERVDFTAQREAVNATLDYLQDRNAKSGKSNLVPRAFLWTWDARPYPFFPDLTSVWADGSNWKFGHWVQGKLGVSSLSKVVADLLEKVGLSPSEYDVSDLNEIVEGYALNQRQTVRDAISMLATAYFFDGIESSGQIKFIERGGSSEVTVTEDDIIPQGSDDIKVLSEKIRRPDLELPQRVDVSYMSRVANYQAGTQIAQRQTVNAKDQISVNIPIVLSDRFAKQIADKSLFTAWFNRNIHKLTLKPQYQYLDPAEIITYTDDSNVDHTIRILSIDYFPFGGIEIEAVSEDVSTYDFYIAPGDVPLIEEPGKGNPDTRLILLDLPAFPSDTDELGSLRMAVAGEGEGWKSTSIYRSDDGGESGGNTFNQVVATADEAILGNALTYLGSADPNNFDNASELQVSLLNGTLYSVTELALLNGANVALCGNEIIQFQNATLTAENKYILTKLLRGRLGTEHEIENHSVGENFILLDSAILKEGVSLNLLNLQRYYKPVTAGNTVAETDEQSFTYTGKKFLPYSPTHIEGYRDGSDNLTINWIRRTRINGEWRDYADIPLGEESEQYEIDIMDGSTVVRTIRATTSTAEYSATDQTTDFGSPQSSVDVKIYQISAIVGRGTAGKATI